jgi:hypothetical protein
MRLTTLVKVAVKKNTFVIMNISSMSLRVAGVQLEIFKR